MTKLVYRFINSYRADKRCQIVTEKALNFRGYVAWRITELACNIFKRYSLAEIFAYILHDSYRKIISFDAFIQIYAVYIIANKQVYNALKLEDSVVFIIYNLSFKSIKRGFFESE